MTSTADPQQIVLAAALVFGLATACQVIAPRLRIPGLVLLLPVGFIFGLIAPELRLDQILGAAFPVAVDLMVAVILFQGGMELSAIPLRGKDRTMVQRLVWIGGLITWIAGSLGAYFILGFAWPLAFMLGAILIVSGPTVVTPILDFVQPRARLRGILMWEGTLLDPLGALFAIVVFQVIKATDAATPAEAVLLFLAGILTAVVAAFIGVLAFVFGGLLVKNNKMMGTQVLLGSVILAAGLANAVSENSGLLAALIMGFAAPRIAKKFGASMDSALPFFNIVVSIGIGVLFIAIAALVPSSTFITFLAPTVLFAVILIVIVRPLVAQLCTLGGGLNARERFFIGWMDPRGIVAAATASSIGATLVALKVPDAENLLPVAFIVITVTVVTYSLTAVPVAKALNVRDEVKQQ